MTIKNTYIIGVHQMFYEIEMFDELIESYIQLLFNIENPQNVAFHFCLNYQQYLEKCTIDLNEIRCRLLTGIDRLKTTNCQIFIESKHDDDEFYNIAAYRRELNYNWCNKFDYILWAESDSWFGKDSLLIIEAIHSMVNTTTPKFILSFAQRKLWGNDWKQNEHPMFSQIAYQDSDDWILNHESSDKSYMSIERMNEINSIDISEIIVERWSEPKFDGSCLVISSELIKSGANIPHSLICSGEDTSLAQISKKLMGDQFVQFHCKNYLHVHNRRHPKKRTFIKNENNSRGFCDDRKGQWWNILEKSSKHNLEGLFTQQPFVKVGEVLKQIKLSK